MKEERIITAVHEQPEPGIPGRNHYGNWTLTVINHFLMIAFWYPLSALVFVCIFLGQKICACFWKKPLLKSREQLDYIHSLFVIRNLILGWHRRACCEWCKCCSLSEEAGVFAVLSQIDARPRYLYDESASEPITLTFASYMLSRAEVPKFSGCYRSVDGGGNSSAFPILGQGGRGYATRLPYQILKVLPDIDNLVKCLYVRRHFKPAINGVNSIATFFANVAIHDFFRSDPERPWVNLHSSFLDLQVLYGYNEELAASVRSGHGGQIVCMAENRLDRVAESWAIIELLRREHNYVCRELHKRYPATLRTDEQLYQQARLVMGATFVHIILREYGVQMFGENAHDGKAFAELRHPYRGLRSHASPSNHCLLSFNWIYQWHTAIPDGWALDSTASLMSDNDMRQRFITALHSPSGAFGARNTTCDLVHARVPQRAIATARRCGAPRLNDFRRTFTSGYRDFADMCGDDTETAALLAEIYPTVEDVELVVGVQVERTEKEGWGLGSTTHHAVVADAFASICRDRFYTTDYTEQRYTEWGYQHSKTTILADLLNRHLDMDIDRNIALERVPSPPVGERVTGRW